MHISSRVWVMPATVYSVLYSAGSEHMKFFAFLLILGLISQACTKLSEYDTNRVKKAVQDTLTSETESWNVNMGLIQNGHRIVLLKAPYALTRKNNDETETHFKGPVSISIEDSLGHITSTIKCDRAVYTSPNSKFVFTGNVVVNSNKKTLWSDHLTWLQESHRIATSDFVIVRSPSDSISGYGLTGTETLSSYNINKITGRVSVK